MSAYLFDESSLAMLATVEEIEKRLKSLGLSIEELPKYNPYKVISGNVTTYYIDGVPLVEMEVIYSASNVTFEVRNPIGAA